MKKMCLALIMILCQVLCYGHVDARQKEKNEFTKAGYKIEIVEYDGHDYLIVRMSHTNNFTVIHYPECRLCKYWDHLDLMQYQGCVDVKSGGKYTVDQSGYIENS